MDIFKLVGSIFVDTGDANKSLDKTQDKADKTSKSFANAAKKAGKMAVGIATAATTVASAAFKMASSTAEHADEIDKMSQKLGISRQAYQELDFVLSQSGTDIQSMSSGMKTLLKGMDDVSLGNEKAIANFEALGVSVLDANGNMRSQEDVLYDVITAFQGMEDGAEKTRLAQKLLGKSGVELMPLLNSEAGSFEALTQRANELGIVMGDDTIDAGVKMQDSMDEIKRSVEALGGQIGAELLPIVQKVLDWIIKNMPMIRNFVENAFGAIKKVIEVIGPTVSSMYDAFKIAFDNIKRYLGPVFSWLTEKLGGVQNLIQGIANALSGLSNYTTVLTAGKNITEKVKAKGIPGQAEGGYTAEPGLSWVGERGPELVYMPKGATVIPLDKAGIGNGNTDALLQQIIELLSNQQKIELDGRELGRMVRSYA